MCSYTERLERLIVLHICSFLMSHDSRNMSLGDIEAIVSYNQFREEYCELFVYWVPFSSLRDYLIANEIFHEAF